VGGVVIEGVSMDVSATAEDRTADESPFVEFVLEAVALELRALDMTQKVMASAESVVLYVESAVNKHTPVSVSKVLPLQTDSEYP